MKAVDAITVRSAVLGDAEGIFELIQANSDQLVPRSMGNIVENVDRFIIALSDGEIIGSAAYQIHPEIGAGGEAATVEIQSVAVRKEFRRHGAGRSLVEAVIGKVSAFSPKEVLVLTFTPEFFRTMGFVEIPKTKVMHKLYTGCINCTKHANPFTCPEIAMIRAIG